MPKVLWVALPLAAFGLYTGIRMLVGKRVSRRDLNLESSLVLMAYVLVTAGLGIFWVANQQLPVFDLHYLFGYGTIVLVAIHLTFNLRVALAHLRRRAPTTAAPTVAAHSRPTRAVWLGAGFLLAIGAAFGLGMRHGSSEVRLAWSDAPDAALARPDPGRMDLIERYHEHSALSRAGLFTRAPSVDWGAPVAPFKRYPGRARTTLPPPATTSPTGRSVSVLLASGAAESPATAALDLAALSTLLFHTAGITETRGGYALRAAPSSGGLFPTEVYLAISEVRGIGRGLYHYQPEEHALVKLTESLPELSALGSPAAPVTVILTAVFRRTGHKYRDRAYRYVLADTGHLIENLRTTAAELGLPTRAAPRFDDSGVAAALAIDATEEGVIAVIPIAADDASPTGPTARSYVPAPAPAPETGPLGMIGAVHRATSLRAVMEGPPAAPAEPTELGDGLALPPAAPAAGATLETIRARRSHRRFTDEPVPLSALSSLLRYAAGTPPFLSRAVAVHVVASHVVGLAPGAYRYLPGRHMLASVRPGDLRTEAEAAALAQEVIGRASAVVVLSIDRAALRKEGAHGYRLALLETGMLGERVYLEAGARGLGACAVGAFYDDEAARLVTIDPSDRWVVHLTAIGNIPR